MSIEIYAVAVGFLLLFAVFDLIVGVSNDAVNFLSSSIGSRVASVRVILLVASLGLLCGVLFSNGMMEVARKGIFHPQYFTMPELVSLFTAVMLADILILDLFNTYGLPTSTTVSIVFELLGAAAAIALMKVVASDGGISDIGHYINSAKTLSIVFGILLSVIVAFAAGAVVQFFARLSFTFDYQSNLSRWGGVWGGLAIASISLFIMLKGAKGAAFLSADDVAWIQTHSLSILSGTFVAAAIVFQVLCSFFQVNVLKPIVLIGTFALALAFAANDLVNFIGVPLAGLESYKAALLSA
ncbi:MAG: inorganic phosphate transporter, partial [Bdellovibrionales bacterium]|nr:inorganic phosphate transporter [Bdellovibrionales bacterium]